jgi:hypothetical protein
MVPPKALETSLHQALQTVGEVIHSEEFRPIPLYLVKAL